MVMMARFILVVSSKHPFDRVGLKFSALLSCEWNPESVHPDMKTSRIFVLSLLTALFTPARAAEIVRNDTVAKPNILFIIADDMGYSDAGCYGGEIQTPNLDRLASNGLRFTQIYNTARCWSSRACIMTGYYAQAVRRDAFPGKELGDYGQGNNKAGANGIRPRWAQLLPEYLKPLGYRSYHAGKWHIDGMRLANGFDRSYTVDDHNRYFSPQKHSEDDVELPPVKPGSDFYLTTHIADEAIKFLKEHAAKYSGQPFFQHLAFTSPHFPIQAPPQDIALYKDRYQQGWNEIRKERYTNMEKLGIVNCDLSKLDPFTAPHWNLSEEELRKQVNPNEVGHAVPWDTLTAGQKEFQAAKMAAHAAMVHRMDIEIGRVIDQLKAMGALDNTLIFFVSDNGASAEQIIRGDGNDPTAPVGSASTFMGIGPGWSSTANTPLRLHKSWVHEGGIATPLIVQWPAGLKAHGEWRTNPGHLIDLVPTVLDIVGAKRPDTVAGMPVPPLPGKSLVPVFAKDGTVKHDYLWFCHDGNRAIRMGDWKLVADHQQPWELYELGVDRSETKNLAAAYPDKVKEMEHAWLKHAEELKALAMQDRPQNSPGKANADKMPAAKSGD